MEGVTHHYVSLPTGVRLHYVEWAQTTTPGADTAGAGSRTSGRGLPPLVLCHGWPDFWFTWRHQVRLVRVSPPALLARCLDRGSPPPPVCRYELLG
jgi:pimeloyl-ACP methyl ester carboxylesterase